MTALRCTAKLLKAMKARPEPRPRPAGNRLGEWTANLIRVSRIQLVIAVSESTRLGVALDAAPYAAIPERFGLALFHALIEIGIHPDAAAKEVGSMWPMEIAASSSRSVLGTLNQYAAEVDCGLRYGKANSAAGLTRRLAETIVLSPKHIVCPADRAREAFGLPPLDRRRVWLTPLSTDTSLH